MTNYGDGTGERKPIVTSGDPAAAIKAAQMETLEGVNSMLGVAKKRVSDVILAMTRRGEAAATIDPESTGLSPRVINEHLIPWLKDAGVDAKHVFDQREGNYIQLKW